MVKVVIGDMFKSSAQTLINTVNCVGVMGKGIALEFKKRFPAMYADYVRRCSRHEVRLGEPYLFRSPSGPWIINFPTKDHWRSPSRLDAIMAGLDRLVAQYRSWGITSLAVPPLGCGLGQLEWRVVGPTLYRSLERLDIPVTLFAPHDTEPAQLELAFLRGEMVREGRATSHIDPAWVALVLIVDRIHQDPFHRPLGRIAFQKLSYFATEAGIPTSLTFTQGSYGPFAVGLKDVTAKLLNNKLIEEHREGQMFLVAPGQTFRDARRAFAEQLASWQKPIEDVADLFLRLDSRGAEVAASVHFAAKVIAANNEEVSEGRIVDYVLEWKKSRKPPIMPTLVQRQVRYLNLLGWIRANASPGLDRVDEAWVGDDNCES